MSKDSEAAPGTGGPGGGGLRGAWTALAVFGAAVAAFAALVGAYSLWFASRPLWAYDHDEPRQQLSDSERYQLGLSHTLAVVALSVGGGLFASAVWWWAKARRRAQSDPSAKNASTLPWWVAFLSFWGLVLWWPSTGSEDWRGGSRWGSAVPAAAAKVLSRSYAAEQAPTAIAAAGLVLLGLVAAVAALRGWSRPAFGKFPVAVGLVLALVASGAAFAAALRLGDDSRYTDTATAPPAGAVAPVPSVFGPEAYRLAFPSGRYGNVVDVAVAGPGFVVATRKGLVAYDGRVGAERWHYLRKPGGGQDLSYWGNSLKVYDHGRVVVASFGEMTAAFEADTGKLLWTGSQFFLGGGAHKQGRGFSTRTGSGETFSPSILEHPAGEPDDWPLLRLDDPDGYAAYDPWTGALVWKQVVDPRCRPLEAVPVRDAVVEVRSCRDGSAENYSIIARDPKTGAVSHEQPLGSVEALPGDGARYHSITLLYYAEGNLARLVLDRYPEKDGPAERGLRRNVVFDASDGALTDVPDSRYSSVYCADPETATMVATLYNRPPKGDYTTALVGQKDPDVVWEIPGDAADELYRCEFLGQQIISHSQTRADPASPWRDQIVSVDRKTGAVIGVQELPAQPDPSRTSLLVVPGATLVVTRSGKTVNNDYRQQEDDVYLDDRLLSTNTVITAHSG
ncbi:hypothetical protein HMPREF9336_04056 [Segniliparus rugosus ATCC BAA-974]|uniref:Pyrrolo-quinoline quinone repeat domain-containing protein n=1 Tax=Segniliparus rugosus (strain ATCC BAA-974 / DSM 45345 / CCUG 50838 / CIP 108380 / JCM 13579 / CDC 945) TaxID=679197 RepID=U1M2M0_SEGRC|nr:hypothetical protein HMPREF9336_04056 [Segniliparus rugosus ATCC BAA-974]